MERLIESLEKFGLSKKESKVYLACLELGESTANEISLKTHLPRTLIYDLFKRLIEQGIASFVIKDKKKYFSVINPRGFIRLLKEKEEMISSNLELFDKVKKKKIELPKAKVNVGVEGIKTALDDILNSGIKEFYTFGSSGTSFEIMPYYIENWHLRRIKKKINGKMIYNDTRETRKRIEKYPKTLKLIEYKFLPIKYSSPTVFVIYGNKILLIYWSKEPVAIVIENQEIMKNQKEYFNQLWKLAK